MIFSTGRCSRNTKDDVTTKTRISHDSCHQIVKFILCYNLYIKVKMVTRRATKQLSMKREHHNEMATKVRFLTGQVSWEENGIIYIQHLESPQTQCTRTSSRQKENIIWLQMLNHFSSASYHFLLFGCSKPLIEKAKPNLLLATFS